MTLTTSEREQFVRTWGTVLMQSWEDDDYKARLNADPKAVLVEAGLDLQDDATVRLETPPADAGPDLDLQIDLYETGRESGDYLFYVQESNELRTQEITEQELDGVAAGASSCSILSCCCC